MEIIEVNSDEDINIIINSDLHSHTYNWGWRVKFHCLGSFLYGHQPEIIKVREQYYNTHTPQPLWKLYPCMPVELLAAWSSSCASGKCITLKINVINNVNIQYIYVYICCLGLSSNVVWWCVTDCTQCTVQTYPSQSPHTLSKAHSPFPHIHNNCTFTTAALNINSRSANPLRNSSRLALHTLEQQTSCQPHQPPRSVIVIQLTLRGTV